MTESSLPLTSTMSLLPGVDLNHGNGKEDASSSHKEKNVTDCASVSPPDDDHRAVHRIRLSALEHNYLCVEAAANKQRCSVITVVKADGYGHGAVPTALHLADYCGADAFAVATLEEGIQLRRAFESNPPGRWSKQLASHFHVLHDNSHPAFWAAANVIANPVAYSSSLQHEGPCLRPARIRILVLGPPVGFPRCFDDYYFHGIELMVSGPEVAKQLLEWVRDEKERKRTEVERAANETKAKAFFEPLAPRDSNNRSHVISSSGLTAGQISSASDNPQDDTGREVIANRVNFKHPSNTLGNVSGQALAKEVRNLLMNQKAATIASYPEEQRSQPSQILMSPNLENLYDSSYASNMNGKQPFSIVSPSNGMSPSSPQTLESGTFLGIEAEAKNSRIRAMATNRVECRQISGNESNQDIGPVQPTPIRKRLRWHAMVDTGMGRLGFKTHRPGPGESRRDTVEILQELVDAEIHSNAPIEFYGMCTHMAEASATSAYTHSQTERFISLLQRVREAGISVPTVSTDNSAALLTTTLRHFDADKILSQHGADTRGYVRVSGAMYGQRPAFPQLKAVSTLCASVRHVAVLRKGESVGYDRAYVAPYDVRIATLTIGFADGYPRALGNGMGKVQIRGKVFPVAGNVCMDMIMVDLGPVNYDRLDIESQTGASVVVGDTAILWGPVDDDDDEGMVRLQDLATILQTTQSALTCGLDKLRVRRQFVEKYS